MHMCEHPPHASMSIIFIFIYLGEVYQAQRDEVVAALDVLSRQKEALQQIREEDLQRETPNEKKGRENQIADIEKK